MLRSLMASLALVLVLAVADRLSADPTPVPASVPAPAAAAAPAPEANATATAVPIATPRVTERQAIRQMPLLMRPNRPGHFYGNTVRRLYYGRQGS